MTDQEKQLQDYRERDYYAYSRGELKWDQLANKLKLRKGMTVEKMLKIYQQMEKRSAGQ